MPPLLRRREIIKTFFLGSALSRLLSESRTDAVQFTVQNALPDYGMMKVRVSDFPVLEHELGSVRIGTSPIDSRNFPVGVFYPVLINRGHNGEFYALDTACSHEGCTVPPLDPASEIIQCRCHGSQYAIDGSLLRGPAGFGLRSFKTSFDGTDLLAIELPDLAYTVEVKRVTVKGRIGLQFLSFANIDYELRGHSALSSELQILPFSAIPDGPLTQTSFSGIDDFITLYVDAGIPTGFIQVVMKTKEV